MEKLFNFQNKKYGLASCGEILLRLSPINNEMLVQGTLLEKNIGGAEFNVATTVSSLGIDSTFITKLPKNGLGHYAKQVITSTGIDPCFIVDDDSSRKRLALYFYEYGATPRKPNVTYDRENSSFQFLNIDEVDNSLFGNCEIFHISGISLGLCENSKRLTKDLIRKFKENNTLISFDVNFRRNLWGNEANAKKEIDQILPNIDILFASEETFRKMFRKTGELKGIIKDFAEEHNISVIASTQRTVNSPKSHNFTSLVYSKKDNKFYTEKSYDNIDVIDRIGSGDAYVGGSLYGILKYNSLEMGLRYGNACGATKATIKGDYNCASIEIINSIIENHRTDNNDEMNR